MMKKDMPFGKEKMLQNDTDALIYRTESKLHIEGSRSGVKGGVFPAVASLAAMLALIIGGAYIMNSPLVKGNGDIEASNEPAAVTPAADATPDANKVPTAKEDIDGISIEDVDVSLLPKGVSYYYGTDYDYDKSAVVYLAVNYSRYAFEPLVSENEHFRVTIEYMLCDDITVNMVAKIEALDEDAKEYLKFDNFRTPQVCAYDVNGNYIDWVGGTYLYGGGSPDTDTCRYFVLDTDKAFLGGAQLLHLKVFANDSIAHAGEPESDVTDCFTGIEFDIDTASNLATMTLATEDGEEIYISPLGFYRRKEHTDMIVTEVDVENDNEYTKADSRTFTIKYEDGSTKKCNGMGFGDYHYNIEGIASIDYNGQTYYPQ